jgi:hypothetical protein
MIAFSLNKELNPQEIISGIAQLIKKEVESPENSILVISLSKVSQVVENSEPKCIEA